MLVNILDSIFAEVIPGTRLYGAPRWMLRGHTVLVGPSHSAEEHEQHVLQTIGSADWMWSGSDELRFDRKNLLLQSVQFNVPERQVDTSPLLLAWQTARQVDGQLRLTAAQGFQVNIADVRWLDSSGETLICLAEEALVTWPRLGFATEPRKVVWLCIVASGPVFSQSLGGARSGGRFR